MTLKTLKDMGINFDEGDLKQEAIKEIKLMRREQGKQPRDCESPLEFGSIIDSEKTKSQFSEMDFTETISYIKWKNNLTEEDLK